MASNVVSIAEVKSTQSRLGLSRSEAIRLLQWVESLAVAKSVFGSLYHSRVIHQNQRASIIAIAGIVKDEDNTFYWGCAGCAHRKAKLDKKSPLPIGYRMWQPPSRDIPKKLQLHRPTLVLCPSCIVSLPKKGLYDAPMEDTKHVDERLPDEETIEVVGEAVTTAGAPGAPQ